MADKPSAEISITADLVRALLAGQARSVADAATLRLAHVADGWDCSVWRLGTELAVRLPRRALAAPLVVHEQRVLSSIADRFTKTGVGVPVPVLRGGPGNGYPWSWSIVPWFEGGPGFAVPRAERTGWADPLAAALGALHVTAPPDFPVNPMRGVPLAARADAVAARFASLRGRAPEPDLVRAQRSWDDALDAPPWADPPVWIHGDLHPGNLIARGTELVAIIDFGDVTAGDPAYDLAVAWLAFDRNGRSRFVAALEGHYDAATWIRARGWAAAVALMLLDQSDDNPEYAAMGAATLSGLG